MPTPITCGTPSEGKNGKKKRAVMAAVAVSLLAVGGFFAWASFSSPTPPNPATVTLPYKIEANDSIWLGLMAAGTHTRLQYFPSGYSIYPKTHPDSGSKSKTIRSFEINNPAIGTNPATGWQESFAVPAASVDIVYQFTWREPDSNGRPGRTVMSEILGSNFRGQSGWVNVMPEILAQARDMTNANGDYLQGVLTHPSAIRLSLDPDQSVLVRTFWADDNARNGYSNYVDIQKIFAFRGNSSEVSNIGLAESPKDLWGTDGTISADSLKYAYYATVWVKPGASITDMDYFATVEPQGRILRFLTIDVDSARIDSKADPKMYNTYIDANMAMWSGTGASAKIVQINQENRIIDDSDDPTIYRVAPYDMSKNEQNTGISDSHGSIPKLGPWTTQWQLGPSGSFEFTASSDANCYDPDQPVPIGHPQFPYCYGSAGSTASLLVKNNDPDHSIVSHPGITQHTLFLQNQVNFTRYVKFTIHNISDQSGGNAFAIAADTALWPSIETDPKKYEIPAPNPGLCNDPLDTGSDCPDSGNTGSGVTGKTTVERDFGGVPDGENGFDDDTKVTASGALHTYKTEICNNTQSGATSVFVKLNLPNKVSLVGSGSDTLSGSTLVLDGSRLPGTASGTVISMGNFFTDINLGDLAPGQCRYVTYQAKVDPSAVPGDEFLVKNQFKHDGGGYSDTNQVRNYVDPGDVDCSVSLVPNPASGSTVYRNGAIQYAVTCKNNGTSPIGSGSIDCDRQKDTTETICNVGTCVPVKISGLDGGQSYTYTYAVRVRSDVVDGTHLPNACVARYDGKEKTSNTTDHIVSVPSVAATCGGSYQYSISTPRSKLLNSPNGAPRADGYDKTEVVYSHKYTGAKREGMYPNIAGNSGGYTQVGPKDCESWDNIPWKSAAYVPYTPGSYFYNVNSSDVSPNSNIPNPGNTAATFDIATTLPSGTPKTVLYGGSLTPTYSIPGNLVNDWFNNGWSATLPVGTTVQRAVTDGSNGKISSNITGSFRLDRWEYVPVSVLECVYGFGGYSTAYRYKYQWQLTSSTQCPLASSDVAYVDVAPSAAWFTTINGDVHTNQGFNLNGSASNVQNLGESGYGSVMSPPKLYTPVGASHSDYFVSSNTPDSNLVSKKGWYVQRDLVLGHGDPYDRDTNYRSYYSDLLEKKLYGPVVNDALPKTTGSITLSGGTIYHQTGNLTLYNPSGTVQVSGGKGTIVVDGDLYVKSNVVYKPGVTYASVWDISYLGIIVKGNVYISPSVTDVNAIWHVDGSYSTGQSSSQFRNLGQVAFKKGSLDRKAPEEDSPSVVNAPSEKFVFDDSIWYSMPPGFQALDDGKWDLIPMVNQFSGKQEPIWKK